MKVLDLPPAITPTEPVCPVCECRVARPDRDHRPTDDPCAWLVLHCAWCGEVFRGRFYALQQEVPQ
jgi:hypothetical protein